MQGKITKIKNGNEYAYPVTVSEAVFVEDNKNLSKKLNEISKLSGLSDVSTVTAANRNILVYDGITWKPAEGAPESTSSYKIELVRWGIKNDGTDPINTTQGINNAILWAKGQGIGTVILPKGTYLIDKESSVKLQSNTHYKLHDALFIKERNNKPKYRIIDLDGVKNVTVEGVNLKGDRETHDYTAVGVHEGGIGIGIDNDCENILIRNCNAYEFTGDGFAAGGSSDSLGGTSYPTDFAMGDIGSAGNVDATKTNYTTVTKFFDVTHYFARRVGYFNYTGNGYGGYGGGWNLDKVPIKCHSYAADNTYLGSKLIKVYENVYLSDLPNGTTKVRFSFPQNFNSGNGDSLHYVNCNRLPTNIKFEGCKTSWNRRTGGAFGGRFFTFQNCEIFNNGRAMAVSSGAGPGYGVDIEDGYKNNQFFTFINCNFHSNQNGDLIAISTKKVVLRDNKFYSNVNFGGPDRTGDEYLSEGNIYFGGVTGGSATSGTEVNGTYCTFRNDSFFGSDISLNSGNTTLDNCVFTKCSVSIGGQTSKIYNCKFTFDTLPTTSNAYALTSQNLEIYNSLFDIRNGKAFEIFDYPLERALLSNVIVKVTNCDIAQFILAKELIMDKCQFINMAPDARRPYARIFVTESLSLTDCKMKNITLSVNGGNINNPDSTNEKLSRNVAYATHVIDNNEFLWDAARPNYPIFDTKYVSGVEITNNKFFLKGTGTSQGSIDMLKVFAEKLVIVSNNSFSNINDPGIVTSGAVTIDKAARATSSTLPTPKTVIRYNDNRLNSNVTLTYTTAFKAQLEKLYGNAPITSFATTSPVTGSYELGELIYNSAPTVGASLGWICLTAGISCEVLRKANTNYLAGDRIYNGTYVYEAQNNGRSTAVSPTFSTTMNATTDDKSGTATWTSKAYVVGNLVVPTTTNGYYYECTTAGTASATQPTWTTTEGSTITDGTVIWTARKIITWKLVANKATFNEFGLISH